MSHHERFSPRSPRKEVAEFGSPMVSYKGPFTWPRAKFITLVTHLDLGGFWKLRRQLESFPEQNEQAENFIH